MLLSFVHCHVFPCGIVANRNTENEEVKALIHGWCAPDEHRMKSTFFRKFLSCHSGNTSIAHFTCLQPNLNLLGSERNMCEVASARALLSFLTNSSKSASFRRWARQSRHPCRLNLSAVGNIAGMLCEEDGFLLVVCEEKVFYSCLVACGFLLLVCGEARRFTCFENFFFGSLVSRPFKLLKKQTFHSLFVSFKFHHSTSKNFTL